MMLSQLKLSCRSQGIFPGVTPGSHHLFVPDIGLGVTDHYRGLHADLTVQHLVQGGKDDCLILAGGGGDDTHRGLRVTMLHEDLPGLDDLFGAFF